MDFYNERLKHVQIMINQNPQVISLHRQEKRRVGGGFDLLDEDLPTIIVRIFRSNSSVNMKTSSELVGTKQADPVWSMLCDHLADVKAGPDVTDSFEVEHIGKFIVQDVRPTFLGGKVVSYQCQLELIK